MRRPPERIRRPLLAFGCAPRDAGAVEAGELRPGTNGLGLAAAFDAFLTGLSVAARDRAPAASLDVAITELMRLWDQHAAGKAQPARTALDHADAADPRLRPPTGLARPGGSA